MLAANSVLWNLFLIGGFFLDGFATAAETLCGQAVGARDAAAFQTAAASLSLRWCLGFGLGGQPARRSTGGRGLHRLRDHERTGARGRPVLSAARRTARRSRPQRPSRMTGSISARPGRGRCAT
ncbi:MATE family efflux transporter [Methylobacterium oryzae CBMB20]